MPRYVPEKVIIRLIEDHYFGCCTSCHQNFDLGYSIFTLDLGKGRWSEVCCQVAQAYEAYRTRQARPTSKLRDLRERRKTMKAKLPRISTGIEIMGLPPLSHEEYREMTYRRGYADGWIVAIEAMWNLMVPGRCSRSDAYDRCYDHYMQALGEWKRGPWTKEDWPPRCPVKRARKGKPKP